MELNGIFKDTLGLAKTKVDVCLGVQLGYSVYIIKKREDSHGPVNRVPEVVDRDNLC